MKTYDKVKQEATPELQQSEKLRNGIKELLDIWDTPQKGQFDLGVVHGLNKAMLYLDLYFPIPAESEADHA